MNRITRSLTAKLIIGVMMIALTVYLVTAGLLFLQSRYIIRSEAKERAASVLNTALHQVRKYMNLVETDTADGVLTINTSASLPVVVDEDNKAFVEDESTAELRYKAYKLGLIVKVKGSTVNDLKINMTDYLRKNLSKRYGKAEEKLILNGTGVKEPLGLLNYDLGCFIIGNKDSFIPIFLI